MNNSESIVAVVGVSPGLGLEVARRFGSAGHPVVLIGRDLGDTAACASELTADDIKATAFSTDAADPESLQATFAQIRRDIGDPSVLAYLASIPFPGEPSTLDPARLVQTFRVNVQGSLVATQAVLPSMRAQGRGTIILTASGLATKPFAGYAALSIAKAGVRNLGLMLASELGPVGIHVAVLTIDGVISDEGPFAPAAIAQDYHTLARQEPSEWQTELIHH